VKGVEFHKWADEKPDDLHVGQLLLWRTAHTRTGLKMSITGEVRRMCNGWKDTYHLLPPMTHWDGYKHIIPDDLEWSTAVPEWVASQERTERNQYKFVRLIAVDGPEPKGCPFCGEQPKWQSRDGFITAMPHEEKQFLIGCCASIGYFYDPAFVLEKWNTRAEREQI